MQGNGPPSASLAWQTSSPGLGFLLGSAAHYGEVLWSAGNRDEARKVWNAALSENPNHETLLAVMAKHQP